jgi:hypothetical protein
VEKRHLVYFSFCIYVARGGKIRSAFSRKLAHLSRTVPGSLIVKNMYPGADIRSVIGLEMKPDCTDQCIAMMFFSRGRTNGKARICPVKFQERLGPPLTSQCLAHVAAKWKPPNSHNSTGSYSVIVGINE